MFPVWLHVLSWIALMIGFLSAMIALADVLQHPQRMGIMNIVWPATALFGGPLTLWIYFLYGREPDQRRRDPADRKYVPFPVIVAKSAAHCGSACMIGDVAAEWLALVFPGIALWFGWHSLFADKMYAVWVLDFIFAFLLGILFQYFAIVPMRHLTPLQGVIAALKADTLSLLSWQIGMYGFMAFAQLYLLGHLLGHGAQADMPEFWFMMQIAMLVGFATSYPVNWWLVSVGIKEKM